MAAAVRSWKLGDLAAALGGELRGDPDIVIERPVPAGANDPHGITFAGNQKFLQMALGQPIGAVLVGPEVEAGVVPTVVVANPRAAFGQALGLMSRPLPINTGTHATAVVSPEATIDPTACVGAFVVVEAGAVIGAGAKVFAHCYVGEACVVGSHSTLFPHVTLYQEVKVGERCIIHSGTVIGADGFGFVWDGTRRQKVPQVGSVVIGDDVEIGANSCVDRATAGATRIGRGTKIDNLVQIAHNVQLGADSVLAGQAGIAGSAIVGDRVILGGQAGIGDHFTVCDDVVLGGRSGVVYDMTTPGEFVGMPPMPTKQAMRMLALTQRLPDLFKRLRALEGKAKDEPE